MKNKILKNSITTLLLLFSIAVFSQGKSANLLLDAFYSKIKNQKTLQIIDARGPDEFALNHIEGAVNFNLKSEDYEKQVAALNPSQPVFIYSIAAYRSGLLSTDLAKRGFSEVYILEGGIASWIGGGKPFYSNLKSKLSLAEYKKILASNNYVLVDIGSKYCATCKTVKPILESIRSQYGEKLKIIEIELEESPQVIADLKTVKVFPTLILYENNKIVFKKDGLGDLKNDVDVVLASK
ncbi:rhodanese-related sulfurtransferase [Flavobacterium nitrogenifigens]|uniref:Rhodanese-related sulfurtransferase n=2 Tax=Flavobacterium TaxID=237 RepID=A0A7W7N837_9FLAO|nr:MULTISPECIES: rhodanese-like domain-containing protein [Flavobacterium]MBB4802006.1 rhodanese-related sulfurtransferase [Flavobacterium nitrogenifigens]MBB6386964.1 rhodanese-related sulfurtransferase [Flavobacterium notoginsengisoli]